MIFVVIWSVTRMRIYKTTRWTTISRNNLFTCFEDVFFVNLNASHLAAFFYDRPALAFLTLMSFVCFSIFNETKLSIWSISQMYLFKGAKELLSSSMLLAYYLSVLIICFVNSMHLEKNFRRFLKNPLFNPSTFKENYTLEFLQASLLSTLSLWT